MTKLDEVLKLFGTELSDFDGMVDALEFLKSKGIAVISESLLHAQTADNCMRVLKDSLSYHPPTHALLQTLATKVPRTMQLEVRKYADPELVYRVLMDGNVLAQFNTEADALEHMAEVMSLNAGLPSDACKYATTHFPDHPLPWTYHASGEVKDGNGDVVLQSDGYLTSWGGGDYELDPNESQHKLLQWVSVLPEILSKIDTTEYESRFSTT
jgi:hypothetical protein